jgi:mRNA-degrading endonuclease toxin of MazEF toxin-antitoxin module
MDEHERWNKVKQSIDKKTGQVFFKEREIWWMTLGQNVGHEENGKNEYFERPVLILKVVSHYLLIGIPITSKNKDQYYKFCIGKNNDIHQYAIWTQLRVLSSKRLIRKECTVGYEYFQQLRAIIKSFL